MMNLQEEKKNALQAYKEAKNNYLQNMTPDNWRAFCDAKMNCMRLGVIIQARKKGFSGRFGSAPCLYLKWNERSSKNGTLDNQRRYKKQ